MPSPYITKLVKETGKSEKEIEKLWKKAKEIASEDFGKDEDDFGSKEYSYTTGVVKKMLGVDESILDPSKFLESECSAKDYLETVVSGNFSIGNVQPPKDEIEDEEDEDDDEEEDDEYYIEEKVASSRLTSKELADLEKNSLTEVLIDDIELDSSDEQLDRLIEEQL